MIGQLLTNYRIEKLIGEGGMARVFRAVNIRTGKKVAIKVLNDEYKNNTIVKQRFTTEAIVMKRLKHSNIVNVIEFIETNSVMAIVMELLHGQSLTTYVKTRGGLSEDTAKDYMLQILSAIDFAHKNGVVHRDIKPSNIFVTENYVKVLDFGVAKLAEGHVRTKSGTAIGTPMYMSPEQVRDSKNIDNLSDIYSLGVLLYFMIKATHPYDSRTLSEFDIKEKIVKEQLSNVEKYPKLNAIIKKATQKDPKYRFLSCDMFAEAILDENNFEYKSNKSNLSNKLVIGRSRRCDIVLTDKYVSREHAMLTVDVFNKKYIIKDLSSTTGTFVNGNRITGEFLLQKNDEIRIGNIDFPWKEYVYKIAENIEIEKEQANYENDRITDITQNNALVNESHHQQNRFVGEEDSYKENLKNNLTWLGYYNKVFFEYINFKGRANRKEYWSFVFFTVFFYFLFVITLVIISGSLKINPEVFLSIFTSLYFLIHFLPYLGVSVRRMHDTNNSGWVILVPIYNLILTLTDGTIGDNKYGKDIGSN